jgi:hypothetical protein
VKLLTNPSIAAGAALDLAGLALVAWSLPEGGLPLAAGVILLLAGAALITRASSRHLSQAAAAPQASDWKLAPALRQSLPRSVRLRPLGYVIAAAWLVSLTAVGWLASHRVLALNPPIPSQTLVEAQGIDAVAEIHEKVERSNSRGEPRYYFYYSYEYPAGSEVRASIAVTKRLYDRYQLGDTLALKLLPASPPLVFIPELTQGPFAMRGLLIGGVIAGLMLVFIDAQRRRHKRLVRSGLPVAGTVENLRRRGGSRTYQVRYRVGGGEHIVRASERNPSRRNKDQVTVLHDPGKPSDAVVYEGAFYKAV